MSVFSKDVVQEIIHENDFKKPGERDISDQVKELYGIDVSAKR